MVGYLGEIRYFAGSIVPKGWAHCNGQTLTIESYEALFSILGFTYTPWPHQTVFNLPNLNGKVAIGAGQAKGLSSYALGSQSGTENVTLTEAQLPTHTHDTEVTLTAEISLQTAGTVVLDDPEDAYLGNTSIGSSVIPYAQSTNGNMKSGDLNVNAYFEFNTAGLSFSHNNMQPYLAINYIICIEGYYPQGVKQ